MRGARREARGARREGEARGGARGREARGARREARGAGREARGARREARGARREARGARREARGARREARGARRGARREARGRGARRGARGARREQDFRIDLRRLLHDRQATDDFRPVVVKLPRIRLGRGPVSGRVVALDSRWLLATECADCTRNVFVVRAPSRVLSDTAASAQGYSNFQIPAVSAFRRNVLRGKRSS